MEFSLAFPMEFILALRILKGKTRLTYIRKRDLEEIKRKTEEYRLFQKRLEYVRHLNKRIDDLFKRIREIKIKRSGRIGKNERSS